MKNPTTLKGVNYAGRVLSRGDRACEISGLTRRLTSKVGEARRTVGFSIYLRQGHRAACASVRHYCHHAGVAARLGTATGGIAGAEPPANVCHRFAVRHRDWLHGPGSGRGEVELLFGTGSSNVTLVLRRYGNESRN